MKLWTYTLLLSGFTALAQYPVLENVNVTQTILNGYDNSVYRKNKVLFPAAENFLFNNASSQDIRAAESIKIEGGNFKAGPYTGSGQLKLKIVPAELNIAAMNYQSLGNILRYEKLELGIALPADILAKVNNFVTESAVPGAQKLNPFLDWELRVVADFKHLPTGYAKSVDGFYFRNMVRDAANNTWQDAGTGYPFRVRFAPPSLGSWECRIRIVVNGVQAAQSETFPFNVVASSNPGFAYVSSKQFRRGGKVIYPLGTNLPFPGGMITQQVLDYSSLDQNFLPNYPLYAWTDYLDRVAAYGDQGGRYIRVIHSATSSEIEFEKLGNYYSRLKFANEMDNLLDICHQKGIMIDFNLMLHTPIMKGGDYDHWPSDYGNFNKDEDADPHPVELSYCYSKQFNKDEPNGLPVEGISANPSEVPSDMIMNDNAFKYIKQRYRYYISRYGYSTDIYMFELLSEPWHMNENVHLDDTPYNDNSTEGALARLASEKFHTELASYIKSDLQHNEHLIGAMAWMTPFSPYPDKLENTVHDNSWSSPNIDVICLSNYSGGPGNLIISKDSANNDFDNGENSQAHHIHIKAEAHNKPVFLSETGIGDGLSECSGWKMHKIHAMQKAYMGLAGFNMWEGWTYPDQHDPSVLDHSFLWAPVIDAQNHVNDAVHKSVFGSGWVQGRQFDGSKGKEHQYLISEDKASAVGYVYNRTYNAYTLRNSATINCDNVNYDAQYQTPANISEDEQEYLMVEGLQKNKEYRVTWYRFSDGSEWYTACSKTGIGSTDIKLRHPELMFTPGHEEGPLYWYKIERANCDNPQNRQMSGTAALEEEKFSGVKIFPNPVRNTLNISSGFSIESYSITDMLGKKASYRTAPANELAIDLSGLAPGVYLVQLNSRGPIYKIVKL